VFRRHFGPITVPYGTTSINIWREKVYVEAESIENFK
jgi:hypothetical protein